MFELEFGRKDATYKNGNYTKTCKTVLGRHGIFAVMNGKLIKLNVDNTIII